MLRPSPELEQLLLLSPEAREERRADRLGEIAVSTEIPLRGRAFPIFTEGLALDYDLDIDQQELQTLGRELDGYSHPLFNKFTRGYRVAPNKESVERYITAANVKQKSSELRGLSREESNANKRRQTQHISDRLQNETFTNMYVAQLWRTSLRTIQFQIQQNSGFDLHAAALTSDAIRDVGLSLLLQNFKGLEMQPVNVSIGNKLLILGEVSFKDPEILRSQYDVLRLVRREQAKRFGYWAKRAKFLIDRKVLGDRRTKSTLEAHIGVQHEIERQILLLRNDSEAA